MDRKTYVAKAWSATVKLGNLALVINRNVSTVLEHSLTRIGLKGTWLPLVARGALPAIACICFVVMIAASGGPKHSKPDSDGTPKEVKPDNDSGVSNSTSPSAVQGRPIHTNVVTSTAYTAAPPPEGEVNSIEYINAGIRNVRIIACDEQGELHILFDYNPEQWILKGGAQLPEKFLVRLFDAGGEYITHFTTEWFMPEKYDNQGPGVLRHEILKPSNNHLTYRINVRDLTFAKKAELGFAGRPVWISLKTVQKDKEQYNAYAPIHAKYEKLRAPYEATNSRLEQTHNRYMANANDLANLRHQIDTTESQYLINELADLRVHNHTGQGFDAAITRLKNKLNSTLAFGERSALDSLLHSIEEGKRVVEKLQNSITEVEARTKVDEKAEAEYQEAQSKIAEFGAQEEQELATINARIDSTNQQTP